ncbi:hypothetical protein ABB37_09100 [Leptomonas pyrrhocoris]|uniref:Uncharacterized protein n=1 Tax=Leptomonas pyrrhocoris TaxID=157538 RepID=A0A0N0VD14_LEPPY|nr:hypothetical protein ABB37_09100 [Leptomonas pyrrhocoris]XP_015652834.1 hypothetical protein ABB37_09100 [Leptomonas pyrrhocoris]KPA74394.1 hypothetical protein ABB37_09100 [Leptomonas pyrrhocoris]KPA74395.1 hypothetical protein ABB37_09100 [Leptomonas pyrrhocoris]|eukprot:XP_015652833.1 hypothetical protein ABB37_09100 [Leptomonas pyrrhocoris]
MTSPAAAPRRQKTLVHAIKQTFCGATSSTGTTNKSSGVASRRNTSNYPTAVPSSSTAPALSSTRSPRTLNALTRSSSVVTLGRAPETPSRRERRVGPPPEALPTPNFYERFPRAVGPLANVLITSPEEFGHFRLIARPIRVVERKEERNAAKDRLSREDIARGGFFVYEPDNDAPRYFLLHDKKVNVYGTSSYRRR